MNFPIKPMLCGREAAPKDGQPFVPKPGMTYELKWDGYRLIAVKEGDSIRLYTRAGNIVTAEYLEIVAGLRAIPIDVVIDGEILVLRDGRPNFLDLQNRMALPATRRAADLRYVAYDVLSFAGQDIMGRTYAERREVLEGIVKMAGRGVDVGISSTDGAAMWQMVLDGELEGLIAKPLASKYRADYRGDWVKIKRFVAEEFVVCGYTAGIGNRAGTFGALVIGQRVDGQLKLCGMVGTGFTFAVLDDLVRRMKPLEVVDGGWTAKEAKTATRGQATTWLRPELVGVVEFAEKFGTTPRFPAWKGLVA